MRRLVPILIACFLPVLDAVAFAQCPGGSCPAPGVAPSYAMPPTYLVPAPMVPPPVYTPPAYPTPASVATYGYDLPTPPVVWQWRALKRQPGYEAWGYPDATGVFRYRASTTRPIAAPARSTVLRKASFVRAVAYRQDIPVPVPSSDPIPIALGQPVDAQPGQTFVFQAAGNTQYRIAVSGVPPLPAFSIGMYVNGKGFRANKVGQNYCDGSPYDLKRQGGPVEIRTFNINGPYRLTVTKRSAWSKWFGW